MDVCSYRGWDGCQASFLVLDYRKPRETRLCVESIRRHAKFPFKTYLLSNGASERYPYDLYEEGLVDYLLLPKRNGGQSIGTQDLFRICSSPYAFYIQSDQSMRRDVGSQELQHFIDLLQNPNYGYVGAIGLAGDVNRGAYSERAHFINVPFYLSIPGKGQGGPGPFDRTHLWLEQSIGEWFKSHGLKFAVYGDPVFRDMGKYTIRELPCGGVIKARTDNGRLEVLVPPKSRHPGYDFSNAEWDDMVAGRWQPGRVPEKWQPGAFEFWDSVPWAKDL